jgi:hypothetical protein
MNIKRKRLSRAWHIRKLSQAKVDEAYKEKGDTSYERALERAELRRKGRGMKSPNKRCTCI